MAGAVLELDGELLLVCNRRRNGSLDWSTPGGVIDATDESLLVGLTREVEEETGLRVTEWAGPVYEVRCDAPDLGWRLRVEAHLAVRYEGELRIDDPDGIVVDARFVDPASCSTHLVGGHPWVREPLAEWLVERWTHEEPRPYGFHVAGDDPATVVVTRHS